jgi:predicted deacylase
VAFAETKDWSSGKVSLISTQSGGDIHKNSSLIENLSPGSTSHLILKSAQKGTPLIQMGKGNPKVMMISGVHGNELPPQIAALQLIEELQEINLRGTVFLIPFAAPWATMENTRWFKGSDLNRASSSDGSITF